MRIFIVVLVLFAGAAQAQGPAFHVMWSPVTTQTDGTVIDTADVTYVIIDQNTSVPVCATAALECHIDAAWGECMLLYAIAKQISTAMESAPSNVVNACTGTRPDFPLSAPVIEVTIENGGATAAQ